MKPNNTNKMNRRKRNKRTSILLMVLVLVLTSITLTLSESQSVPVEKLLYLSVEKPLYEVGEQVTLIIASDNLSEYELSIISESNYYKYSGELPSSIDFYPKEQGEHLVGLTNKTRQGIADSLSFMVGSPDQESQTSQSSEEETSEASDANNTNNTNNTNIIITDKQEYQIGETVNAVVNVVNPDDYKLYYEYRGETQRYMGDFREIAFVPGELGTHYLVLADKYNTEIIVRYEFRVVETSGERATVGSSITIGSSETIGTGISSGTSFMFSTGKNIKIKDSKGEILDSILRFFDKDDLLYLTADTLTSYDIPKLPESIEIFPRNKVVEKIKIRGLKSQEIILGLEKVHPLRNPVPKRISVSSYAIDPTAMNFTNASVTKKARGTELWKCKEYNFTTQTCWGTWQKILNITPGKNYTFILTPEDPLYSETRTNVSCSCQGTKTSRANPARAECNVSCAVTIDVPSNTLTGYLMNMSYGVQITITGDVSTITSASHRGRFDRDQTYGHGHESTIGTSTTTSSANDAWTNRSLHTTGTASFTDLTCDDWADTCTWYVYLSSAVNFDPPGSSTKTITTNITLLNMSYTWNYTEPGNLSVSLNWPDDDYVNSYNITFNYTPLTTANLTNCTLYTNRTGSFTNESTDNSPDDNESNYFNLSFSSDGIYIWNVNCNDSDANTAWGPYNNSFTIDTVDPTVNLESPADGNKTTNSVISFYFNVSDTNPIRNCSLVIDDSIVQTHSSITKDTSESFNHSLSTGNYTWAVWCFDMANNIDKSDNRTINVTTTRQYWNDRWYESGTSNYSGTTANINLANQTDGTQNQVYWDIPGVTTVTLVDATSPYIGGDGAYIFNQALVTFRAAFAANQNNGRLSWHLYILHSNSSQKEVCYYGDDGAGGATVVTITEQTCNTSSDYRLLGTDRLRLVLKVYNTHGTQNRDVTHYFDHTNSYVDIDNFITLGHVQADLIAPSADLNISQNETYNHSCNITCIEGTCLNVNVYAQYNSTLPTSENWRNITSSGYLILNGSETNPHSVGNLSSNSTNTTFIILGDYPSTNYIQCYAESMFSSDESDINRKIRVKDTIGPEINLTNPDNETYTSDNPVIFYFHAFDPSDLQNCSLIINGSINTTRPAVELTNNATNNFTVSGLQNGSYLWTVNCTDDWGNEGTAINGPRIIYIDDIDPWITQNYPGPAEIIGYETVNFNWTAYDNYDYNLSCDLYINDTLNQSGIESPQGVATNYTVTGFAVGNYTWYMNCSDEAGNRNISETRNFTVIDISPTVNLTYPGNNAYLDSSTVVFYYNASDNNGFKNCTLYIDGLENYTNSTIYNNEINNFTVNGLSEGLHNWTVSCIDTGDLNDTAPWWNFTIDLTYPNVTLNFPDPADLINNGDVSFNYTAVDNFAQTMSCELRIDGNSESNDTATNATPEIVNINNIDDGLHYWNVSCDDYANNTGNSSTRNFTINESPTVSLGTPIQWDVTNENVTFTYTPNDNDGFTNCTIYLDGNPNATNSTIYNGVLNNFTIINIPEGNHTWYVGCYDNGTYLNYNTSAIRNFTVDATPPTLVLNYPGIDELVANAQVDFNFTANDTVDTQLDCDLYIGGIFNQSTTADAGNDTIVSVNFTNGRYNWSVICYDDGNNSNTSETRWFNVSVPPTVNLTSPDHNEYLNYTLMYFEYIPSANSNITTCTLFVDGVENETNTTINSDVYNDFWITYDQSYEGKHNWTVRCTDEKGLTGWGTTRDFYLDYSGPTIDLNQPADNNTLSRNRVFFNFTMTDIISPNATCNLTVDGALEGPNLFASNATPVLFNQTFPDGNYSWYVECIDLAGNYNISDTWNFTIIAPPNITLLYPPDGSFTNQTYVNLTYLPEDDYVIPNCSLYLNGSFFAQDNSINTNQNNSFDIDNIGEGYYNWTVYCVDQDGNTFAPLEWNFTVDRTAPRPSLYLPAPGATLYSEDVLFNFSAADNLDIDLYCNLTINSSINQSNIPVNNGSWRNVTVYDLQDTIYFWNITCWDRATNTNYSETWNFTVESPPRIALGDPEQNYRTNNVNMTFFFTPTDNSGNITNCTLILNGQENETLTTVYEGIENNITLYNLSDGTYNWTVNCTDPNGNEGTNSSVKTFYIDLTGPNITLNQPTPGQTFGYDDITFNWTPTDFNNTNITCNLTLDDSGVVATLTNLSGTDFITTQFGLLWGTHYWNVTCADDLNNTAISETRNFTITRPDLTITTGNITFNNSNPDENDSLLINATVYNLGGADGNNSLIQFWDGEPGAGGVWIDNITIDIPGNTSIWVNATWNISLGLHTIWVIIDPNNTLEELDDSNNNATRNISVLRAFFNSPPNQTTTNDTTPEINFTMQDFTGGIINYTIYVDGTPNGQTGSGTDNVSIAINLTALSDGIHYIVVQATDELSRDKNSTNLVITIDSLAPTVNFETQNQTWFNHSNPNIYFNITDSVDDNINYSIYLNGTFQRANNISNATTTNETLGPLVDGIYNVTIQATDDNNNSANYTIVIYVDTTAPAINLTYPDDGANFTTNTVMLNFTANDNLDSSLTCNLTVDGSIYRQNFEALDGQETNTTVTGLSEGIHYWNVTCGDNASNRNTSETRSFNVYNAPLVNLVSPADGNVTSNQTVIFYFNVSDETGIFNCSLLFNGSVNTTKPGSQIANGSTNNFTVSNLNGTYIWAVRCIDNSSLYVSNTSSNRTLYVDPDAPYPVITTANYTWFNTTTPQIDFIIIDHIDNVLNYTFYVNGSSNASGTANNNTPSNDNLIDLNSNASFRIVLQATDDAGNSRNSTSIIIYVDTVRPTINLSAPSPAENFNITTVQFNFTAWDNMANYTMCNLTISNGNNEYNINVTNNTLQNITKGGFVSGIYYWNVTCIDLAGNRNTSKTWNFTILAPDLLINTGNISFNDTSPQEGTNITIFANMFNIGGGIAQNITVQFWEGDPDSGGTQINGNKTISSIASGNNYTVNVSYNTSIGSNTIFVVVDPPTATNGSIQEENESNNKANKTLGISLYHIYAGNTTELIDLEKQSINLSIFQWNVSNATGSNIFVTDLEANLDFFSFQAISRNTTNDSVTGDFEEIDTAFGSTNYSDSINITYTSGGVPKATRAYEVFTDTINNVPIVNSTNTSNFQTGILWDTSDGNIEYNGTQDLIFISEINKDQQGGSGIYDFEIKVPALLRNYNAAGSSVAFYFELK